MDINTLYEQLAKRIKYLRAKAGLTQEKLAEKTDLGLDHIGKVEVNIRRPSIGALLKISNALNVPIKELFDFDNIEK